MAFTDAQEMSGNRIIAIIIVLIIHAGIGYVLVTGLAYKAAVDVIERVTTIDVDEPPPPEPEDEPPPPPENIPEAAPPPPVAPPARINIAPPPPIRTQQTIPPPSPPVLRIPPPAPPAPPAPRPAPAPPPAPSQARGVSPDGLGRWAQRIQDDYPSAALRRDEEGTVTTRLTVGPDGRVQACTVTGSSGSSALDQAACRGLQRYARYNPALNAAGNPISSTTTQAIRYVLPD
jgi:protein TonB